MFLPSPLDHAVKIRIVDSNDRRRSRRYVSPRFQTPRRNVGGQRSIFGDFFFFNYGESGGKKIVIYVLIKIRYPNTVTVMMLTNVLSVSPWNRQGYFLSHSYGSLILFATSRRR